MLRMRHAPPRGYMCWKGDALKGYCFLQGQIVMAFGVENRNRVFFLQCRRSVDFIYLLSAPSSELRIQILKTAECNTPVVICGGKNEILLEHVCRIFVCMCWVCDNHRADCSDSYLTFQSFMAVSTWKINL